MAAISGAIAAVASVAGAALGANAQANAAEDAAGAISSSNDAATALQREQYYDSRAIMAPGAAAGAEAQARRMLMQGIAPDVVKAYLRDTKAALATPAGAYSEGQLREMHPESASYWDGLENDGINGNAAEAREQFGDFRGYVQSQNQTGGGENAPDDGSYDWVDDYSWETSSPSYQFRFDEGAKAAKRKLASGGRYFSGAADKALTRYGQNVASQEFEADFDRFGALAGQGQDNADTVVQVGSNFADDAATNARDSGNARASAYSQSGNAWGDFWAGAGGYAGGFGTSYPSGDANRSRNGWYPR